MDIFYLTERYIDTSAIRKKRVQKGRICRDEEEQKYERKDIRIIAGADHDSRTDASEYDGG